MYVYWCIAKLQGEPTIGFVTKLDGSPLPAKASAVMVNAYGAGHEEVIVSLPALTEGDEGDYLFILFNGTWAVIDGSVVDPDSTFTFGRHVPPWSEQFLKDGSFYVYEPVKDGFIDPEVEFLNRAHRAKRMPDGSIKVAGQTARVGDHIVVAGHTVRVVRSDDHTIYEE